MASSKPETFTEIIFGERAIIEIPYKVEENVCVFVDAEKIVDRNSVGEIELVRVIRDALAIRMKDRNAKQTQIKKGEEHGGAKRDAASGE